MKEALIGSVAGGMGAALALYVLDPISGRGRRAHARDKWVKARHLAHETVTTTRKDVSNRLHGLEAEVKARLKHEEVGDDVLLERVRAALGHCVTHPGPIQVEVHDGMVTLRGPILAGELPHALARIRAVRGVRQLRNLLRAYEEPGHTPELQGGGEEARLLSRSWSPAARLLAGLGGTGLLVRALAGDGGVLTGTAGALLLGRAAIGRVRGRATPAAA
jgi:hypothetical protein